MSTNDTSGKNIVPQILQFHAEPELTSSKFFSICPIQKNRKTGIRGGGDGSWPSKHPTASSADAAA